MGILTAFDALPYTVPTSPADRSPTLAHIIQDVCVPQSREDTFCLQERTSHEFSSEEW